MADWTSIPDASVDPDAPVTSELMYALRDNPVAITEAAAGAPKIVRGALKTATASFSGTVGANSTQAVSINAYSFFPSASASVSSGVVVVRASISGGGVGADSGNLLFENTTGTSQSIDAAWRYIAT